MTILSEDALARVARFVSDTIGFSYASDRMRDLERGFLTSCRALGINDPDACIGLLDNSEGICQIHDELVKNLTIGETYFFRDHNLFTCLKEELLPALIRSRRNSGKYIRIWSAACSSGEEPYSVAILLRYLLPDIEDWDIFILASDINPGSLHAAERGIYSKWSFREEPPVPTGSYFSPGVDGRMHLGAEIRKMVRFSRLNLVTDLFPSGLNDTNRMDLILCRNVLMYFSAEIAASIVDRFHSALARDGLLLVSPQEISYAQRPGFVQEKKSSVFLFRKGSGSDQLSQPEISYRISQVDTPVFLPDIIPPEFALPSGYQPELSVSRRYLDDIVSAGPQNVSGKKDEPPGEITPHLHPMQELPSPENTPRSLILSGRFGEAEYLLLHNSHPDEKSFHDMEMIARSLADQGEYDRALGWCDRILAQDPLRPAAYHLRAVIQQERGDLQSAIQSLRQTLYADPDYIPGHLMLGMILGTQGRPTESRRHYETVLRILSSVSDDTALDETDGIPAGHIRQMVSVLLEGGRA